MRTFIIKPLLAAVMLFTFQGTAVGANTQHPAVASESAQINETDFQHHYAKVFFWNEGNVAAKSTCGSRFMHP